MSDSLTKHTLGVNPSEINFQIMRYSEYVVYVYLTKIMRIKINVEYFLQIMYVENV